MSEKIKNPFHDERDWLVTMVWLDDKSDQGNRRRVGAELGTLLGLANAIDVPMMAEIGDDGDDFAIYQCLFSFPSQESKQLFLELVRKNELTHEEEELGDQFTVPSRSEINDAEPLGQVVPPDIAEIATLYATMVAITLQGEGDEARPN